MISTEDRPEHPQPSPEERPEQALPNEEALPPQVAARGCILDFQQVGLAYRDRWVFEDVNFQLARGEFAYLIGRTGSGKSSLLKMIYADVLPTQGSIRVEDLELTTLGRKQRPFLRRRLGIVFQDFQLLPDLTVADNLAFVMKATGWRDHPRILARTTELLMLVGLSARAASYPHQLSGGEQQRTVIARALVNDPVLLLADEPTGNLDPEVANHIMEVLHKVNRSGTAVLMATHAHDLIRHYPGRVLELTEQRLFDRGRW